MVFQHAQCNFWMDLFTYLMVGVLRYDLIFYNRIQNEDLPMIWHTDSDILSWLCIPIRHEEILPELLHFQYIFSSVMDIDSIL